MGKRKRKYVKKPRNRKNGAVANRAVKKPLLADSRKKKHAAVKFARPVKPGRIKRLGSRKHKKVADKSRQYRMSHGYRHGAGGAVDTDLQDDFQLDRNALLDDEVGIVLVGDKLVRRDMYLDSIVDATLEELDTNIAHRRRGDGITGNNAFES